MSLGLRSMSMELVGARSAVVVAATSFGRHKSSSISLANDAAQVFQISFHCYPRANLAGVKVLSQASTQQMQVEAAKRDVSFESAPLRVMFAAGGTGGHVYPAISIAQELQKLQPNVQIEFVGTKDRMEWLTVPKQGFIIRDIPAASLKRPIFSAANLLLPLKLLVSIITSWRVISKFQPHVVVGTGGYVSGPVCLVAALSGRPLVLQEQNSRPGITNKLLGRLAKVVFVAFSAAAAYFPKGKSVLTGNPTRLRLDRYISSMVARRLFFPDMDAIDTTSSSSSNEAMNSSRPKRREVVLVLGGSLGAKSINVALAEIVMDMLTRHPQRYIIWQTGAKYYDEVLATVGSHPRLAVHSFIESMETAYAAADLVVSRAGAVSCSEILVAGKPSILIPSPNVAEDHQAVNARSVEEAGAARVLSDSSLSSSPSILASAIGEIMENKELLDQMATKALKMAAPNAATEIAKRVLEIGFANVIM